MSNTQTTGTRFLLSSPSGKVMLSTKLVSWSLLATAALVFPLVTPSHAVVVISDGFGDGDVNNDGLAFENDDVIGSYEPFLDANMMRQDSPLIFPAGTMVNGPTVADNPNDTGIKWLSTAGFGTSNDGPAASRTRIVNDAAGVLPETVGNVGFFNAISGTTQHIPALDSGLALGVESKGRGRTMAGFFETDQDYSNGKQGTIALGPNVDDEVKVSFDFRVWMSNENYNGTGTTNHVPDFGQLRFGLFQDTDDELGQTNNIAGPNFTPAVWGEENGMFRGDIAGPSGTGDAGWYVRLPLQDADSTADPLFDIKPNGADARINEEKNDVSPTERILQGSDNQTVALPDQMSPDFVNLETTKRYNVVFSLKRFDETGGSTDPNDPGDNIRATLTVTDIDTPSDTWSFGGFDSLSDESGAGFDSDSWDYFSMALAGASDSNDFDFLMDNFTVEVIGSNEPNDPEFIGDYDDSGLVSQGDLDIVLLNWGTSNFPGNAANIPPGGAAFDGLVSQNELDGVLLNWGNMQSLPATAVPEPASVALLYLGGLLVAGQLRRHRESSPWCGK